MSLHHILRLGTYMGRGRFREIGATWDQKWNCTPIRVSCEPPIRGHRGKLNKVNLQNNKTTQAKPLLQHELFSGLTTPTTLDSVSRFFRRLGAAVMNGCGPLGSHTDLAARNC